MNRTLPTPDQRATALARRQHGALSHEQASACGLTNRMIERRVLAGLWRRVAIGVFVIGGAPDTHKQRAMLACLATGGVASHQTAAALHGLAPFPVLPHVTVASTRSARCRQARVHRSVLDHRDLCTVDGVASTTLARAFVDIAATVAVPDLAELVDDAVDRRVVRSEAIRRALERAGPQRRGRDRILSALAVWEDPIRPGSPAEAKLVRLLRSWGHQDDVLQHEVREEDGRFVARVDVAWPVHRTALEYVGTRFHGPRATTWDEARLSRLEALGWTVEEATKLDLIPGERRLLEVLRRVPAPPAPSAIACAHPPRVR